MLKNRGLQYNRLTTSFNLAVLFKQAWDRSVKNIFPFQKKKKSDKKQDGLKSICLMPLVGN